VNLLQVSQPKRRWISLTPLIDVVFILLMFFMLTTQFYRTGVLNVSVSKSVDNGAAVSREDIVRLRVFGDGRWQVDDESFDPVDVESLARRTRSRSVLIEADESASLQSLIAMVDRLASIGVSSVNWLPQFNEINSESL